MNNGKYPLIPSTIIKHRGRQEEERKRLFLQTTMIHRSALALAVLSQSYLVFLSEASAFPESTALSPPVGSGGAMSCTTQEEVVLLDKSQTCAEGNLYLRTDHRTSFDTVSVIAAFNIVLNLMRPDPSISIQMRIPRLIWEITILVLAKTASNTAVPAVYLLLACILASTAFVDLFVWAPLFATFAHFKTCEGGLFHPRTCRSDYTKGVGRMMVAIQCLGTGLFYLLSAIAAMGSFTTMREEQKVDRQARAMLKWSEYQRAHEKNV